MVAKPFGMKVRFRKVYADHVFRAYGFMGLALKSCALENTEFNPANCVTLEGSFD
jgi:hypothetical protein